jgi:hypothetical protein
MRKPTFRSRSVSAVAIGVAVIWGAVEFFALQWSGLSERLRTRNLFRAS